MLFRSLILLFFGTRRTVFRYTNGFYLFPVLARILPFFGTHTDCTIFRYSNGFNLFLGLARFLPLSGTNTDSTIFLVLIRTIFHYSNGLYLFPVLARILALSGTHTDSSIFRFSSGQFFRTQTDSTFSWYSHEFHNYAVLTLILQFFCTHPESFLVLEQILPFPGTLPDSTIIRY